MSTKDSLTPVFEKVELLLAEMRYLRSVGPHFRIVHRFRMQESGCGPGEELFAALCVYRGREYDLRLPLALLILLDYLAHSRLAQSARQIELGIRANDFYTHHAENATGGTALTRKISRSAVKEYIWRLHCALSMVFQEAGLIIDPCRVLIVEKTVGNEVRYRLKASFTWIHLDLTSRDTQPQWGRNSQLFGK